MFPNAELLAMTDLLQETLGLFPLPLTPSSCAGDAPLQPSFSVVFVSVMETDTSSMTAARIFFFFFFSKSITFQAKLTTPAASGCKLEKTVDPLNFSDLSLKQKIKARLGRCPPHMVHRYGSGSPLWVFAPCLIVGLHTVRKLEWPCVKGLAWTIGKHAGKSTDFRERHSSINHRTVQGTAN